MMKPEQWERDYERIKADLIRFRSAGTLLPKSTLKAVATEVTSLAENLRSMKKDLNISISHSEMSRREVLVENMRKMVPLMTAAHMLQTTGGSGTKDGSGNGTFVAGSHPGVQMLPFDSATANPIQSDQYANKSGFTDKGLMQRQVEVIALQDAALKDIEAGIGRLHNQATEIGQEAKLHISIINSLDENVDQAADELRAEAKHAEDVRMRSRMCCLYMCLVAELAILIVLLIIVFQVEHGFQPAGSKVKNRS